MKASAKTAPVLPTLLIFPEMFLLAVALMAQSPEKTAATPTPEYTFEVLHVYPHDPHAFTQGLAYRDGFLYESTGLNGRSSLRKVRLESGEVIQRIDLGKDYFGEGMTLLNHTVVQLTWLSHTGFVYDLTGFHLLRQFAYSGEGWGLTTHGRELLLSDGTADIRVLDPVTFQEKRHFSVHDGSDPVAKLNELEFVEGQIYANVWQTDRIARISPKSGRVVGWIDLTGILSPMYRREQNAVLNGIAYDPQQKRLFVTGKLWPSVFQIRVVPKSTQPRWSSRKANP